MDILNLKAFELYKKIKSELDFSGLKVDDVADLLNQLLRNYSLNHNDNGSVK